MAAPAAQNEKKISEGLAHVKAAEKYLKTSFLKWKPDYDSASHEFQQAATCFKNAKVLDQAKTSLLRAADANYSNKSFFQAAKNYEQAAIVCRDMGDLLETAKLIEKASFMFMEQGTPDTAAITLEKGAKMLEQQHPERSVQMYLQAFNYVSNEDKFRQAAELAGKASRLLCSLKKYGDAADYIQKEIEMQTAAENLAVIPRLTVARVLVFLALGDWVAASKCFNDTLNCPDFTGSDEASTLQTMLDAYENGEGETVANCLAQPHIKYMDNEYAKLVKMIKVPNIESAEKEKVTNEDDEFAGGLC